LSDFPLWFFIFAIGLNVFFAKQRTTALGTYLNIALPMLSIYYLASEGFSVGNSFSLLAKAISIFSILVALGGLFECVFHFNPLYEYWIKNPYYKRYITGFVRPMSTQFNPAPLGSYLLASLPFNFLLFKQNKSAWKALGGAGIVLNIVVLILTFSRGAFLGLIAATIFYSFMQHKHISITAFSTILLIFVFVSALFPYPFNRFSIDYIIKGKGTATFSDYRMDRYLMTGSVLKEHPLVGLGFQHFRERFYEYYPRKNTIPYEVMIADNMYLTLLAETGIIGLLGFLLFIFSLFRKAWRKLNTFRDMPQKRQGLLLVLSAFVGLLVNMAGYELFYWPNPYIYFCILIGLIEAYHRNTAG
jgi:O-antigen ligase